MIQAMCMRNAHLRVLPQEVLHRVLVHLQRIHKVLRIAPHAQRVAAPRLATGRLQIAWHATILKSGFAVIALEWQAIHFGQQGVSHKMSIDQLHATWYAKLLQDLSFCCAASITLMYMPGKC